MARRSVRSKKESGFLLFLKGLLMGLFDLVPGISGGTMALITGIYKELISEINNAFGFLKSLFFWNKKKIIISWKKLNKFFLIILVLGIATGVVISVFAMSYFLNNFFAQTMGAISGVILVASLFMIKKSANDLGATLIGLLGFSLGFAISVLAPMSGHDFGYLQTLLLGTVTITAMILPGISGALILLLLGGYEFMIEALRNIGSNYLTVTFFILGAIIGLGIFSKGIHYLLKKHHDATMSFLSFLMLGAITKPILEILNANNPEASIPFFFLSAIILLVVFVKK